MSILVRPDRVCVIGAGASGLIAALAAAECGDRVTVLEKDLRPGRKLLATGNGRCNLMNRGDLRYFGDAGFAEQVFRNFGPRDLESFFQGYGLLLREDKDGRVYPNTMQAATVLDVLKLGLSLYDISLRTGTEAMEIRSVHDGFSVRTDREDFRADRVILATGGLASPKLGGSDSGYHLLHQLGHPLIPTSPSLCPMLTDRKSVSGLSGIRARCSVRLLRDGFVLREETGEVIFTDRGISGICVMQCARFARLGTDRLELDLIPPAFTDHAALLEDLHRRRDRLRGLPPETLFQGMLPLKLGYAVCKQAGLALRGECAGQLSDEQLDSLARTLCHYRLEITGLAGFDAAQVTAGGADTSFFSPRTLDSGLLPGLHVTGELLNVDGDCGGYNLMFAFASGILAGRNGRTVQKKGEMDE